MILTPNVKIVPVGHGVIKSQVTQHQNARIAPPVRLGQVLIKPAKQIIVSFVQ
jgi:cobyric acid synthase